MRRMLQGEKKEKKRVRRKVKRKSATTLSKYTHHGIISVFISQYKCTSGCINLCYRHFEIEIEIDISNKSKGAAGTRARNFDCGIG